MSAGLQKQLQLVAGVSNAGVGDADGIETQRGGFARQRIPEIGAGCREGLAQKSRST